MALLVRLAGVQEGWVVQRRTGIAVGRNGTLDAF